MHTEFQTISHHDLDNVAGGSAAGTAARVAARAGSRAIPVVGQAITVADAGYSAYTDYNRARAQGHGRLRSAGEGALGALNSLSFGASNWLLGRE